MSSERRLIQFLADFLVDEEEDVCLRGPALRNAVLSNPDGALHEYGLKREHVDMLLEHGPNPDAFISEIRAELMSVVGGPGSMLLWPARERLFIKRVKAKWEQVDGGYKVRLRIKGGGFHENMVVILESAGGHQVTRAVKESDYRNQDHGEATEEEKRKAIQVLVLKGRRRLLLSGANAGDEYVLRLKPEDGGVYGAGDRFKIKVGVDS